MIRQAALDALRSVLGDQISTSKPDLDLHSQSEAHFTPTPPDAVAYPRSTAEVSQIVKICAKHACPIIGWGAGTSLEGHTAALQGGVVVDFSQMNRVLAVNAEDMDAIVQPGVTRKQLDHELRSSGLFCSVDPGADASFGGMASTRASGTTTVRYGTIRENIRALEVVLADGRIIRTGSRARKSASGYDLTHLFIGAEGTLGLITELTVNLHTRPEATAAAICAFNAVESAVNCVIATIQSGIPMARIELVDAVTARAFNGYAGADMPETPHLMVEFHGSDLSVAQDAERFGEIATEFGATGFTWSDKTEERNRLWSMRHNAYYASLSLRPGARGLTTDICVPISRLAEAIEETRADIAASPLIAPIVGHVGDGNFHTIFLLEPGNKVELDIAKSLSARMVERALRLGGTATGEHGIGMGKLGYMEAEHGDAWRVMGDIKRALDPQNIMNPGKVVLGN